MYHIAVLIQVDALVRGYSHRFARAIVTLEELNRIAARYNTSTLVVEEVARRTF